MLLGFLPCYPGVLRYQDTSTGHIVAEHKPRLGPLTVMRQNPYNAVLGLGHPGELAPVLPVALLGHAAPERCLQLAHSSMIHHFIHLIRCD
jgi:hypothetical protein